MFNVLMGHPEVGADRVKKRADAGTYNSTKQQSCSSKLLEQIKLPHLSLFSLAEPFLWAAQHQQPPLFPSLKLSEAV